LRDGEAGGDLPGGNYPDETSAREEIGRYVETYNRTRPHQALFNFTPAHVHEVNNKSMLLQTLAELIHRSREKRKAYWTGRSSGGQQPIRGGCPGKGHEEIVDPGANTEEIFDRRQPNFQKANDEGQKITTHLLSRFCLIRKKLDILETSGIVLSLIFVTI
jgi:hypothetical protein